MKFKISFRFIIFVILNIYFLLLGNRTGISTFIFLYFLFIIIFILSILVFIFNYLVGKNIEVERSAPSEAVEGDYLQLTLTVRNNFFLPLVCLIVKDFLECDREKDREFFIFMLKPREIFVHRYGCMCQLRGKYKLGPIHIVFSDLFSFFSIEKNLKIVNTLYVYPRIFKIRKLPPLVRGNLPWFGVETANISGDEHEFFGIREYKPGDPIKRIHWLSTARKSKLIVKEYQKISFYRVAIFFTLNANEDVGKGKEKVSEYIIKIVASLVDYFTKEGICIEIMAHAGKVFYFPSNKGSEHSADIFKFLAIAKPESKVRFIDFFKEYSRYISSNSTAFFILTDNSFRYIGDILYLKERNISVVPIVLVAKSFVSSEDRGKIKKELEGIYKIGAYVHIKPILVFQGENLEEKFQKL